MKKSSLVFIFFVLVASAVGTIFAQDAPDSINKALSDMSQKVGRTVTLDDLDSWRWTEQTFYSTSLGCPQAGQTYSDSIIPTYVFYLTYRSVFFEYHASRDGAIFFLCNSPDLSRLTVTQPTSVPLPTATSEIPLPPPATSFFPCPDALTGKVASRFSAGMSGRFVGTAALNLQSEPNRTSAPNGVIQPSATFVVVGGPACDSTFTWWQVDLGDAIGWIGEVDPANLSYRLEPTSQDSGANVNPSNTTQQTDTVIIGEVPASRIAINAETAARVVEFAQQIMVSPNLIFTAQPPDGSGQIVAIFSTTGFKLFSNTQPQEAIESIEFNGYSALEGVVSADNSGIIYLVRDELSGGTGLVFDSLTGGGGAGGGIEAEFSNGVALLPALNLLAFGAQNEVLLYDLNSQQIVASLPLESNPTGLAASPTANLLAVTVLPSQVVLWDIDTRSEAGRLNTPISQFGLGTLAFSPDGTLLAVGSGGSLTLWDVASQSQRSTLPIYSGQGGGEIFHVIFSPEGSLIAVAGSPPPVEGTFTDTPTLQLWDVNNVQLAASLPISDFVMDMAFSPDGTLLNIISSANVWQIWGVR